MISGLSKVDFTDIYQTVPAAIMLISMPISGSIGHGIGLANVRKMVEKYQGFMDVSNTNQIFTVKVMLYL